tara:strand:- start:120 stop:470 length:351 start_codon:yes stop_codon:yes gene_type:complete
MSTIDDFINKIKLLEGFRFDKEVAVLLDVDSRNLASYKSRDELPNKWITWYCERYGIQRKNFNSEIITITHTEIKGPQMSTDKIIKSLFQLIELQEEKIEILKGKIMSLEKLVPKA